MITVPVQLAHRGYDVLVGPGALDTLGERAATLVPGRHAFLITDHNLPEATIARAEAALAGAGFRTSRSVAEATEHAKTLPTVGRLLEAVGQARLERQDPIIALGGGIIGDIAGFVAASYRRGVPVIQCPTTLLSMVDASVGGKTGVNLLIAGGLKKNMAGAFWQPRAVLADIDTLASLPARERRAGLAECLKHGLIADATDPDLFAWTLTHADAVESLDRTVLTELVARNVAVKAGVVAGDEREEDASGGRALLNLGHTFGHAIEPLAHLTPDGNPAHAPLLHGEAVGYGILAAARTSRLLGLIDHATEARIRAGLDVLRLRPLANLPPAATILEAMHHDKKVAAGRLRLILPTRLGACTIRDDVPAPVIASALEVLSETG